MTTSIGIICLIDRLKCQFWPDLRFFVIFMIFGKATAFLGISKIPTVKFVICSNIFVFSNTNLCPRKSTTERFFGYAIENIISPKYYHFRIQYLIFAGTSHFFAKISYFLGSFPIGTRIETPDLTESSISN